MSLDEVIRYQKVIKGLECCAAMSGDECRECPYGHECWDTNLPYGMSHLAADALTLLKEQDAVKPIYNEEKYGDHLPHCGNCEKVFPNNAVYGKVNFCHYCGQAVKWND